MKKVSVIIPTFNRAHFLPSAIRSVFAQSIQDFEVIVIDDGSVDNTKEAVKEFDRRIIYRYQTNAGCSAARNHGLRISSSDYVVFLDSDDLLASQKLEIQSALLQTDSEAGYVFSDSIEFDGKRHYLLPAISRNYPGELAIKHFFHPGIRPGSLMVRRSVIPKCGFFDENMKFNEDSDFVQRLSLVCKGIFSEYPSILQRTHTTNKSKQRAEIINSLLFSIAKIQRDYPEFIKEIGEVRVQRRIAHLRNLYSAAKMETAVKRPFMLSLGNNIEQSKKYVFIQKTRIGNYIMRHRQCQLADEIVKDMKELMS